MKDPLKQGLKPCIFVRQFRLSDSDVEVKDPLKQGLKQWFISYTSCSTNVEVKDPLKQGLKLHHIEFKHASIIC